MYQDNEKKLVQQIADEYTDKGVTKVDILKRLDAKARRGADIFAYTFGVIGSLVLGIGMCLAMKVIGNLMPLGIIIGALGIAMVVSNYYIFKVIMKASKKKYCARILNLTQDILGESSK